MKAMKKVIFLTLVFALALTVNAFAAETSPTGQTAENVFDIWYNRADGTVKESGFQCPDCWDLLDDEGESHSAQHRVLAKDCTVDTVISYTCKAAGCMRSVTLKAEAPQSKHNFSNYTEEVVKDPTCTTAGKTTYGAKCENAAWCKANDEQWTKDLPAAYGHGELKNIMKSQANYDASKAMTADQAAIVAEYVEQYNGDAATSYSADAGKVFQLKYMVVDYKAPETCVDGKLVITCDYCKTELFNQVLKAEGHNWVPVDTEQIVFPTCTTPGEFYVECSKCHKQEIEYIEALGHNMIAGGTGDVKYIIQNGAMVAAHDTKNGIVMQIDGAPDFIECEAFQYGWVCQNTAVEIKKAIFDATGIEIDVNIKSCDHIEYANGGKVQPALWDHVYDLNNLSSREFTKYGEYAGSCTEPSHYFLKCNGCNKWTTQIFGAEPDHDWNEIADGEVTKKATCTANGEIKVTCKVPNCDGVKYVTTDKLPHVTYIEHLAGCKDAGLMKEICQVCGNTINQVQVDYWHEGATNFRYDNTEVLANGTIALKDCTKKGTVTYDCTKCDVKNIVETYEATGHFFNFDEKKDVNKDGKFDNSDLVIVKTDLPTCNTFGYVTLECQNGNCKETKKFKNAEKLQHFDPKTSTLSEFNTIPSTCTVPGKTIETCVCGKTRETALPLASHTPSRVGEKTVCKVCGEELKLDQHVQFNVQTGDLKVTNTSVSGRGQIDRGEHNVPGQPIYSEALYARINYNFTLDNGETVAYVACVEVDELGSFRAASPSCPYGATLTNVAIMITTDADAQDKLISNVTNMGITVIK